MKTKQDEYQCAACGGMFISGRSDADAQAEATALFGENVMREPVAVVCDDCFREMSAHFGWEVAHDDPR